MVKKTKSGLERAKYQAEASQLFMVATAAAAKALKRYRNPGIIQYFDVWLCGEERICQAICFYMCVRI